VRADNEVVPYTLTEESKILAACEGFGGGRNSPTVFPLAPQGT